MNRRDLLRTISMAAAGANASGRQFTADYNASKELAAGDWKPVFLDPHQTETVARFGELVVPGSREAQAVRFIDRLLAAESREIQADFLNALASLDGECRDRYKAPFLDATSEQQTELLGALAHPAAICFLVLKDWVAKAYYSSEAGQRELGSDGTPPHGVFTGCGR